MSNENNIDIASLVHPSDAFKDLGYTNSAFKAFIESTFLEPQYIRRVDDQGRFSDFWFLKQQVENMKGLDSTALLGYHGPEKFREEFEKWEKRVIATEEL